MFEIDGIWQGAIVTVVGGETSYEDEQGRVVEVCNDGDEDGPIGVLFRREQIMHYVHAPSQQVVRFLPSDLRVDDEWCVKELAIRIYGNMFHSLTDLTIPFDARNVCMHDGCDEVVIGRAMMNSWGTIIRRDLCLKHYSRYHGWCVEMFTSKKDWEPASQAKREEVSV